MDPSDLYGLPLEQFTERRNELAKQLRQEGSRDEAARVSKLRKPSVSAWAVNQLARTQRRSVDALFKAGDSLRAAQEDLLAGGGDPAALRRAMEAERAAVGGLVEKARGLLSGDGHELAAARLEQVSETLHAAALDEDARVQISDGCLVRELRHVGLGSLGAAPASRPAAARKPRRSAASAKAEREARRDAARQAEVERTTAELKEAEQRHDRAADELRQAERALDAAQKRADRARA